MNASIILAHPSQDSFNHAIAQTVLECLQKENFIIYFHDLYKEGFDPVLKSEEIPKYSIQSKIVENYCSELVLSDFIFIIHPNWWGQPPAILKGWIDKVLRPGIAYEFQEGDNGEGVPIGLLKAKYGIVFNTSNTPESREMSIFGDPLNKLWKECIFNFCGVSNFHRKMFGIVVTSTPKQREDWLEEVKETVNNIIIDK